MAVSSDVVVKPWGGDGGTNYWRFRPDGRISEIRIKSGSCVDSVRFTYTDHAHARHHSETYGGHGGAAQTITFDDDENLIGIRGTVGENFGVTVIMSLSFQTNKNTYGPYGTKVGDTFSLQVTEGKIVGFSGRYGFFLDSFGVILQPSSYVTCISALSCISACMPLFSSGAAFITRMLR